MSKSLILS